MISFFCSTCQEMILRQKEQECPQLFENGWKVVKFCLTHLNTYGKNLPKWPDRHNMPTSPSLGYNAWPACWSQNLIAIQQLNLMSIAKLPSAVKMTNTRKVPQQFMNRFPFVWKVTSQRKHTTMYRQCWRCKHLSDKSMYKAKLCENRSDTLFPSRRQSFNSFHCNLTSQTKLHSWLLIQIRPQPNSWETPPPQVFLQMMELLATKMSRNGEQIISFAIAVEYFNENSGGSVVIRRNTTTRDIFYCDCDIKMETPNYPCQMEKNNRHVFFWHTEI